jgi:hypothetical protein
VSALGSCLYCGERQAAGTPCRLHPEQRHVPLTLGSTLGEIATAAQVSGSLIQLVPARDGLVLLVIPSTGDARVTPLPADAPDACAQAQQLIVRLSEALTTSSKEHRQAKLF